MNILVDHGWNLNLGDAAQVEGAVLHLLELYSDILVTTFYQESPSPLWGHPRVIKHANYELRPLLAPVSSQLLKSFAVAVTSRLIFPFLGAPLTPGRLTILTDHQNLSMDAFCRPYDVLYIPGGGFLTDVFIKDLTRKSLLMLTFAAQRKPIILTGQQLGPFRFSANKKAFLRVLQNVKFLGLRESKTSPGICQEARLPPERFQVMGDDSFGVKPARVESVKKILEHYGLRQQQFIAINVRMSQNYTAGIQKNLAILGALYDHLARKTGFPLLFVPISTEPVEGEQVTARKLQKFMQTTFDILEEPYLTPALVKGVLSQAWGAVGVSYHFCTFSLSEGVPAICIYIGDYYNQKARGLADYWGDTRLALPLEGMFPEQNAETILELFRDLHFRSKLQLKGAGLASQWKEIFYQAHEAVLGPSQDVAQSKNS
jgi:polysaccharide pyruvyl transferase WcaK-like protein